MFSFTYYRDVVRSKFSFSFKYFLVFSLLLGLFLTAVVSSLVLPQLSTFLTRFKTRAHALYPETLVLEIKKGHVSTNALQPFRIPIPFELFTDTPPAISDQKQTYILTIDTHANVSDFSKSQSLALLTSDSLVFADDNGGYKVYPLKEVDNVIVKKSGVDQFLDKALPLLDAIGPIIILVLFFFFVIGLPLVRLISLLILTLFILMAANLMQLSYGYKKLFQVGLHSITLPTMIQILMLGFGLVVPIPFFSSILFLLYNLVILTELKKAASPQVLEPKTTK